MVLMGARMSLEAAKSYGIGVDNWQRHTCSIEWNAIASIGVAPNKCLAQKLTSRVLCDKLIGTQCRDTPIFVKVLIIKENTTMKDRCHH